MQSEMKIHFCDLCQESVPQSDLDEGRAFLRKGRVVCARCDRAMEAHEAAFGAGGAPSGDVAGPFGRAEPDGEPPLAPISVGEVAPVGASLAHKPIVAHSGGGAAGVTLAVIGLLATAGVALWVNDSLSKLRSKDELDARELRSDVQSSLKRSEASLASLEEAVRGWDGRLGEVLARERTEYGTKLDSAANESRSLQARIDELARGVTEMRTAANAFEKLDQELVMLRRRCDNLAFEIEGLTLKVDRVAAQRATDGQATAEPPASGEAQPPWFDQVKKLASENPTERWEAVDALGETKDPATVPYLVPALADKDLFVRMNAARRLEDLGSPKAIPGLIAALEDPDKAMREAVYHALVKLTGRDFPFDPESPDEGERAKRIKTWQEWWKREKDRYEGS